MVEAQFAGKPNSQPLFSGAMEPAEKWLRANIDVFPLDVEQAFRTFLFESLDDVIKKGGREWAVSMTISKKRKQMLGTEETRPVLMIHLFAWPPIEMIEAHFKVKLEGTPGTPEQLKWASEHAYQYACGLIVEEGNDRRVVEFMPTFKREQFEYAERVAQAVISKFTKKQGE
jgi:hypothetical protein